MTDAWQHVIEQIIALAVDVLRWGLWLFGAVVLAGLAFYVWVLWSAHRRARGR